MLIWHMIAVNSTTVLEKLTAVTNGDSHYKVNIKVLAECLDTSLSSLISILVELEHRDRIKLMISTVSGDGEPEYSGSVQLMDTPPDEERPPVKA
jgi:hypothetical protein